MHAKIFLYYDKFKAIFSAIIYQFFD
jgi:hypothetical protein